MTLHSLQAREVNVRGTFLKRALCAITMTLTLCEHQEWGKQSNTYTESFYLNSNRCCSAPCIVLFLLCFYFLHFNCFASSTVYKCHLPMFLLSHRDRHPPCPPKGQLWNSTSLGGATIEISLLPIHTVNTIGQIPLEYRLYREHQRQERRWLGGWETDRRIITEV